jgi:hypothetical protein
MVDADRPVVVCLFCGCSTLGSPDDPVNGDSFIVCGACCAVHRLIVDVGENLDELVPRLRKLTHDEKLVAQVDPGVKAFRDAFQIDQMESRIAAGSSAKARGKMRIQDGQKVKLSGYGPDHRGDRAPAITKIVRRPDL